jgi:uncharacterized membrane protein
MQTIDIGSVLNRAFEFYKQNISTLLITTLLGGIIAGASFGILAGPMYAGMVLVTLGLLDKTQPAPVIGDLFKGFNFFVPSLVFCLLLFVVLFVGQVVLVFIPIIGRLLSLALGLGAPTLVMFTMFNIVDRKMDVVPAIQASVDVVKTNFWIFLGLYIVAAVIASLGSIACIIGVVVTAPMMVSMLAVAYRDLHPARG